MPYYNQSQIKIFPQIWHQADDAPHCHCPKPKFCHVVPLNPRIMIFFLNSSCVTLITFLAPTSCKVSEKLMGGL